MIKKSKVYNRFSQSYNDQIQSGLFDTTWLRLLFIYQMNLLQHFLLISAYRKEISDGKFTSQDTFKEFKMFCKNK